MNHSRVVPALGVFQKVIGRRVRRLALRVVSRADGLADRLQTSPAVFNRAPPKPSRGSVFRNRRHAVIGSKSYERVRQSNSSLDKVEQALRSVDRSAALRPSPPGCMDQSDGPRNRSLKN